MAFRILEAALAALLLNVGCGSDNGIASVLVVARVEVAPPSGDLVVGQTLQLSAIAKTEGGIVLPSHEVTWSSLDQPRATVTSDGLVQAVSLGGPARIQATVSGVTGEALITVVPLPIARITVSPPQPSVLVGQTVQLTADAFDGSGNKLSNRPFVWSSSAPTVAGVTTTGIVLGLVAGGPTTITATAEGVSGTAAVMVQSRPATRLGFLQQPGPSMAGTPITPAVRVAIQDDLLGTVLGATNAVTLALAANPGGATLGGTKTVAAVNGVATFSGLVLDRAGAGYTLLATAQALSSSTSTAFNVAAGSASQLGFATVPPSTARSGIPLAPAPVVQIRDGSGNPVSQPGVVVTGSIASGTAALGGTVTATTNASGAATFGNLTLSGSTGPNNVSFSAPGVTPVTSATIALGAGNPAALGIVTQPSATGVSDVVLARQPVLQLLDSWGNPVPQAGVAVAVGIASGPGGGSVGGTVITVSNPLGVAAFVDLRLIGPPGNYTLGFTSAGLSGAISAQIAITAKPGLTITTQPSATVSNGAVFPQQPVIQLRDASNNPLPQAGVVVTASLSTGGGVLGGTTTATTNAQGLATFSNLSIAGPIGARTLGFAATGYVSVVSSPVSVVAGAASQLAITTQPSNAAQSGVVFPQQPVVQLLDASNNPVSQSGVVVTAAIATGGGTLGGSTTATTNSTGAAAFTNLSITGAIGPRTLSLTSGSLAGATSGTITLGPAPASRLAITTQPPATAANGATLAPAPVVQLQDAGGGAVSQAGVAIAVALATGSGTLGGALTVNTDATGKATFVGLSITGLVGGYSLRVTATGLTAATSNAIALTAGPAADLTITTQPSASAQSGKKFAQQPTIQVSDASGNPVAGAGRSVTAAINSCIGLVLLLTGNATIATNPSGAAVFSDLAIVGSGTCSLKFTSAGLTQVISISITVS